MLMWKKRRMLSMLIAASPPSDVDEEEEEEAEEEALILEFGFDGFSEKKRMVLLNLESGEGSETEQWTEEAMVKDSLQWVAPKPPQPTLETNLSYLSFSLSLNMCPYNQFGPGWSNSSEILNCEIIANCTANLVIEIIKY